MGAIIGAIWANIGIVHIVLFTLGIIFMVTEFFEPGVGVFGIVGIVLMVIDIFILAENFVQGLILFAALAIIVLLFVLVLLLLASRGILPKKLVLSESTDNESGYVASAKVELNEGDECMKIVTGAEPVVLDLVREYILENYASDWSESKSCKHLLEFHIPICLVLLQETVP